MNEKQEEINIPEDIQEICRDFAKVAQKHNMFTFSGQFTPHQHVWGGDIRFSWKAGRHGEDSNRITITSEFHIFTTINQ